MLTNKEIVSFMEDFGEILSSANFIKDDSPFRKIRNQLLLNPKKYVLPNVEFKTARGEYVRGGVWHSDLDVRMSAEIEVSDKFQYSDAIRMIINIEYSCLSLDGEKLCKGCWHMDYHAYEGAPEYMHPDFHIHHGGRNVGDLDDYGNLILLDNPRVMHHPLDVFLAVDFIISNFYPERDWKKLRGDTRYRNFISKAQQVWWRPYYEKLYNYWVYAGTNNKSNVAKDAILDSQKLNPHYI